MKKEDILNFYQKYKLIIFPVLVSVSSVILIVLVIYPQLAKLISNNEMYNTINERSKFLEVKAVELNSLDETDLQNKLNLSLAALPPSKDYTEVISILQSLTNKTGFNIISLQFGQSADSKGDKSNFAVKLDIVGPKVTLDALLDNIEKSYRPMRVSGMELTTNSGGSAVVNVALAINVYFAQLPSSIGSIDAPLPQLSQKDQELITSLSSSVNVPTTPNVEISRGKVDPFE